jgi:hypothetical protein
MIESATQVCISCQVEMRPDFMVTVQMIIAINILAVIGLAYEFFKNGKLRKDMIMWNFFSDITFNIAIVVNVFALFVGIGYVLMEWF